MRHWLLWDGDCGLCAAAAAWVARRDEAGRFTVIPWQQAPSPPMNPALAAACRQAVQVLTGEGRVLGGEAAVFFVLGQLGFQRLARLARWPLLARLGAAVYRFIARHRRRLSALLGLSAACDAGDRSVHSVDVTSGT